METKLPRPPGEGRGEGPRHPGAPTIRCTGALSRYLRKVNPYLPVQIDPLTPARPSARGAGPAIAPGDRAAARGRALPHLSRVKCQGPATPGRSEHRPRGSPGPAAATARRAGALPEGVPPGSRSIAWNRASSWDAARWVAIIDGRVRPARRSRSRPVTVPFPQARAGKDVMSGNTAAQLPRHIGCADTLQGVRNFCGQHSISDWRQSCQHKRRVSR